MEMKRWRQLMAGVALAAWVLSASALNVGDKAPEFAAPSSTGKEVKLSDFAGKKHAVLFFYIGAFTNT